MSTLTDKQKKFAKEYLKDFNATQAAIRAGYSKKSAYSQGDRLLKKDEIQAILAKDAKKHADKADITVENVLNKIGAHLTTDITDVVKIVKKLHQEKDPEGNVVNEYEYNSLELKTTDEMCEKAIQSIKSIGYDSNGRVKVEMYDKQKAIEQAGKYLKMFTDKQEIQHSGEMTVTNKQELYEKYLKDED